jgi:hypothetical protein
MSILDWICIVTVLSFAVFAASFGAGLLSKRRRSR